MIGKPLFLLTFLVFTFSAEARMNRSLLRSPEALAMGGAYTAFVEDRDAAFYNPAGVAAYDRLSLHLVAVEPTVSNWVVTGYETLSDLRDPSAESINRMMGENVFVEGTASTAVLAPGFALIAFYDAQGAFYAKNQAFPKIEYGYQETTGIQLAFGFSSTDGRSRGRGRRNSDYLNEWRFGVGAKYLSRTGGYRLLTASELFTLGSASADSLIGGTGSGYGFDLGVQRVQRLTPSATAYWGAAFLNVGDITLPNGAAPVMGDLSTGVALKLQQGIGSVTLAYDIQQMNRSDDFAKKQNIGIKIGLPLLDLFGGFHQGFPTYGAAVDVWIARVSATVYREELGPYVKDNPESRLNIRADFKMEL